LTVQKADIVALPYPPSSPVAMPSDSLQRVAEKRLQHPLPSKPGFSDLQLVKKIQANAYADCGAKWFKRTTADKPSNALMVNCKTAAEIYKQLERKEPVIIRLTGKKYSLDKPFIISKNVQFTGDKKNPLSFTSGTMPGVFVIAGNGNLTIQNLGLNGAGIKATHFISSDTAGSCNHYNLVMKNCVIQNFSGANSCYDIFYAYKSMVADSIVFRNNSFLNNNNNVVNMSEEKDNKGYYNAEKIIMSKNMFNNQGGGILDLYRGGNDESTMGPYLLFEHNSVSNESNQPWIQLTGVQKTNISGNNFITKDPDQVLIAYKDFVRAHHLLTKNSLPGKIETNQFVKADNNTMK
jgi:poly(beta-D-mannuronate) lyase